MKVRVIDRNSDYFGMVGTVYQTDDDYYYVDFDGDPDNDEMIINKNNGKQVWNNVHLENHQFVEYHDPEVGMPVTICYWTDRHVGTITEVSKSGKKIKFQKDEFELINGVNSNEPDKMQCCVGGFAGHFVGTPRYKVTRNFDGPIYEARLRKDGSWKISNDGRYIIINLCSPYYDLNF